MQCKCISEDIFQKEFILYSFDRKSEKVRSKISELSKKKASMRHWKELKIQILNNKSHFRKIEKTLYSVPHFLTLNHLVPFILSNSV